MVTAFELEEIVREARAKTGVPGVAAGILTDGAVSLAADGVLELGGDAAVRADTPFRIASITKPFTATALAASGLLDERARALLSHAAGLRCESLEPLPEASSGLWSYSNAGYRQAAALLDIPYEDAMQERVLAPMGLTDTGFAEPRRPARGHQQDGATGHRSVPVDMYPPSRRPSGGLWSTVPDLLTFGLAHLGGFAELHEPQAKALGAAYALGWWIREDTIDHEGSVAGYQSLLLLVPADGLALAVLTNSWRGSGLIRRVVETLDLLPRSGSAPAEIGNVEGMYALDGKTATVERAGEKLFVTERDLDPVTGDETLLRYPVTGVGDGVFAFAHGALMSHRLDFPRPGVARIGWTALSAR
jgi:CubicO group peptidase (beta-lactamase class C family)